VVAVVFFIVTTITISVAKTIRILQFHNPLDCVMLFIPLHGIILFIFVILFFATSFQFDGKYSASPTVEVISFILKW